MLKLMKCNLLIQGLYVWGVRVFGGWIYSSVFGF